MLHKAHKEGQMSIGTSGRIVVEISPALKRELYSALSLEGKSLKEWFLESAQRYLCIEGQNQVPLQKTEQTPYGN